MNTATIERETPAATDQDLFSIESDEPLDKRQRYKAKILEERYASEIEDALARRLAYVKAGKDRITIGLQDENGKPVGKLIDTGDRIAADTGSDAEIQAMIDLAKAKGWKNIKFTGSADFQKRASQAAADAGFEIKGYKPKLPDKSASVMDALAELTGKTTEKSLPVPDPHEQARLAARQRARDTLNSSKVDLVQQATAKRAADSSYQPSLAELKAIDKVLIEQAQERIQEAPAPADPCVLICRTERQRVMAELDKTRADLAKIKIHDLSTIQQTALSAAQGDPRNAHIMEPVRHLLLKRHAAENQLAHEHKRHAERGWLAKATNAGKLALLERAAAEAKGQHLSVAKVVRKKLMESEGVRGPVKFAEYENQRHATLTDQVTRLEHEAQDLQAVELRLLSANGDGKNMLQSLQRSRVLDPVEQRISDLVRNQEKAQRLAAELEAEKARQERQLELAKVQELEAPELEAQHQPPRPK